jgi:hypothetical protein
VSIVSSQNFLDAHTQIDGTRYCKQVCTDSAGGSHQQLLRLSPGDDADARLADYAARLVVSLAEQEYHRVVRRDAPIVLAHQTKEEFAARYWQELLAAYQEVDKVRVGYLIWWVYNRFSDGGFTSNQLRLSFNTAYERSLTGAQWNTLVTDRLIPIRDRYQAMLDEAEL